MSAPPYRPTHPLYTYLRCGETRIIQGSWGQGSWVSPVLPLLPQHGGLICKCW